MQVSEVPENSWLVFCAPVTWMCRKMDDQLKIQADSTMDFGLVLDREEVPAQKGLGVGLEGEFIV